MLNFSCQRCGECCKRYYIISLPREVQTQAKALGISEKEFIETRMQLFLQFFPTGHREDKIVVSSSLLPKKFAAQIEDHLGHIPQFLICLPMLAFKRRENGGCTFYASENSACTIYDVRPVECRLFPFISDKKVQDYSQLYPFCHGLKTKDEKKSYVDLSFIHFNEVSDYFSEVMEKGFSGMWQTWPKDGVCLFTDKLLGPINESEFFGAIAPFK